MVQSFEICLKEVGNVNNVINKATIGKSSCAFTIHSCLIRVWSAEHNTEEVIQMDDKILCIKLEWISITASLSFGFLVRYFLLHEEHFQRHHSFYHDKRFIMNTGCWVSSALIIMTVGLFLKELYIQTLVNKEGSTFYNHLYFYIFWVHSFPLCSYGILLLTLCILGKKKKNSLDFLQWVITLGGRQISSNKEINSSCAVVALSIFYVYYFGHCSEELSGLIPSATESHQTTRNAFHNIRIRLNWPNANWLLYKLIYPPHT